jgi:hypothetical protein
VSGTGDAPASPIGAATPLRFPRVRARW